MEHKNLKNRVGEKYTTNEGYEIEIIEYSGAFNCVVKFSDGTILRGITYQQFTKGNLENPYHPKTYGIGYMGIGKHYAKKNGVMTTCYTTWSGILRRCYNEAERGKTPTYKDVTVCKEWHNFQVFAEWFYSKYREDFALDKDIICPSCRIYSPETCCFVPQIINGLFTNTKSVRTNLPSGVIKHKNKFRARFGKDRKHLGLFNTPEEAFQAYKTAKEQHIKDMADEHRDLIEDRVYQAMYSYEVKITD
jgi:hypothetical protein